MAQRVASGFSQAAARLEKERALLLLPGGGAPARP